MRQITCARADDLQSRQPKPKTSMHWPGLGQRGRADDTENRQPIEPNRRLRRRLGNKRFTGTKKVSAQKVTIWDNTRQKKC